MKRITAAFIAALAFAGCDQSTGKGSGGGSSDKRFDLPSRYELLYDMTYKDNETGEEGAEHGLTFSCGIERMASHTAGNYCGFLVESVVDGFSFDTVPVDTGFEVSSVVGFGDDAGATITVDYALPDYGIDFTYTYAIVHTDITP